MEYRRSVSAQPSYPTNGTATDTITPSFLPALTYLQVRGAVISHAHLLPAISHIHLLPVISHTHLLPAISHTDLLLASSYCLCLSHIFASFANCCLLGAKT